MALVKVKVGDRERVCETAQALAVAEELGASGTERPTFEPVYSAFGDGNQVMDNEAKQRIEAQHQALRDAGVEVNAGQQLYETGTRMAEEGYQAQQQRKAEHDAAQPAEAAVNEGLSAIRSERREDVEVNAAQVARELRVSGNGIVQVAGLTLGEQALRGLCARIESPALSYLLGLRERGKATDPQRLAETLRYECQQTPDKALKLRCRKGIGDIFAVVSPSYTPADFPEVAGDILAALPPDAKGSWEYDPDATDWALRLDVFTPQPVDQQAVGEPFSGYVEISGRDNGTGRIGGSGGCELIRCLNASTYLAAGVEVSRVHRANVLRNLEAMLAKATQAIHVLCQAWGETRQIEVPTPAGIALSRELTQRMFRGLLTERKGVLVGVLPGRTEEHVEQLAETFDSERREPARVVRSDVAQAWTRYSQAFPQVVQHDAQQAIGKWLVEDRKALTFPEK
jgi:hypothetical protein